MKKEKKHERYKKEVGNKWVNVVWLAINCICIVWIVVKTSKL